jgi:hypothetical protein
MDTGEHGELKGVLDEPAEIAQDDDDVLLGDPLEVQAIKYEVFGKD